VPGIARKVQARNDDIPIGGDAQQKSSCPHLQSSVHAGITLSEFERFAPLRTAQASLNGITLTCDGYCSATSGGTDAPQMFCGLSSPIPQCRGQSGSTQTTWANAR
jgi:hypothetical protein